MPTTVDDLFIVWRLNLDPSGPQPDRAHGHWNRLAALTE